jgi:ATP-dependent RNA helicase DeaD
MQLPSIEDVNEQRIVRFKERLTEVIAAGEGDVFLPLIAGYEREHNVPALEIAAALAALVQGKKPLLLDAQKKEKSTAGQRDDTKQRSAEEEAETPPAADRDAPPRKRERRAEVPDRAPAERRERPRRERAERDVGARNDEAMDTYRVEVGRMHGVEPRNIVGAIANEAGLDGRHIGRVVIEDDHSFVDLPQGMPKDVFRQLQKVRVGGQKLHISRALKTQTERMRRERRPSAPRGKGPRR